MSKLAAMDRSVLENKAVAELKEIAKSLDLKVSGLKKAELIDRIAKVNGKPTGRAATPSKKTPPAREVKTQPVREVKTPPVREVAPPMEATGDNAEPRPAGTRDDGA